MLNTFTKVEIHCVKKNLIHFNFQQIFKHKSAVVIYKKRTPPLTSINQLE